MSKVLIGNSITIFRKIYDPEGTELDLGTIKSCRVYLIYYSTRKLVGSKIDIENNQIQIDLVPNDYRQTGQYYILISLQNQEGRIISSEKTYLFEAIKSGDTDLSIDDGFTLGFTSDIVSKAYVDGKFTELTNSILDTTEELENLGYKIDNVSGQIYDDLGNLIGIQSSRVDDIQAELDKRFPFKITSFSGGKIAEKGTTQSVSLSWVYDGTPRSQELKQGSTVIPTTLDDRGKTISGLTGNTTFTLTANGSLTSTQAISFYNCKYIGLGTSAPTTEAGIKALTKLAVSSSRSYTWNGNLNNTRVIYCYPKAFGALTSIKDANGFDYLGGYLRSEVTCNGETYYVYVSSPSTITGFRQIFA